MGNLLGHIHYDASSGKSHLSEMLALRECADQVFRNRYVRMVSEADRPHFLGRIVEGPFFLPEEVGRDSAFAQTAILRGEEFKTMPNYYTLARIEILGQLLDGGQVLGTNTRPYPKSKTEDLDPQDVQRIIGISGDMRIGTLGGYPDVRVLFDSKSKKVIPRNIGIFGTVGSGKTNTAQVLIEEASQAGYAVIVFDVEGEYVEMDKPSTEVHLHDRLKAFGCTPEGLTNLRVFHPCNSEASRPDSREFDLPFSDLSPYLISELADLSEPQEGAFLKIVEKLREDFRKKRGKRPVAKAKSSAIAFLEGDETEAGGYTIADVIREIPELDKVPEGTKWPLERKMRSLERTGIFDQGKGYIDPEDLLKPGQVSVIDVSGVSHDGAKNLSIAYILRRTFDAKVQHTDSPKTLVLLEEAHTFVSREARDKMTATMDMLKLIARRGRKRWLALGFVSQQPAHLPDEIFELCNTRFIHSIKSDYNLTPVKKTSGDVISELWDLVPGFGPGQALVGSPQFTHTIMVDMRPCKTKRRLVE